jgi:small-conductance mechanosensitive channel
LKSFRQGSALAVALTGMFLLIFGGVESTGQNVSAEGTATQELVAVETNGITGTNEAIPNTAESIEQATGTIRDLFAGAISYLPKVLIAILILAVVTLVAAAVRRLLRHFLGRWARTDAIVALARIGIFLVGIAAALTVLAGDVRALLGSLGLVGLALSWALQTPIESFTGWLLNSFRGYYHVGDRIEVGEVFGDVYKIDVLTTTVWEAGGPGKAVAGAQATGALITFPNWEVLRSNIVNYSRDFPFVWDEITLAITNESDLNYTIEVLKRTARSVLGDRMEEATARYRELLQQARLNFDVEEDPSVFVAPADSWTNFTIRYLVPARTRRGWATKLYVAASNEIGRPEHQGKIRAAYPRSEVVIQQSGEQGQGTSDGVS